MWMRENRIFAFQMNVNGSVIALSFNSMKIGILRRPFYANTLRSVDDLTNGPWSFIHLLLTAVAQRREGGRIHGFSSLRIIIIIIIGFAKFIHYSYQLSYADSKIPVCIRNVIHERNKNANTYNKLHKLSEFKLGKNIEWIVEHLNWCICVYLSKRRRNDTDNCSQLISSNASVSNINVNDATLLYKLPTKFICQNNAPSIRRADSKGLWSDSIVFSSLTRSLALWVIIHIGRWTQSHSMCDRSCKSHLQ